MDLSVRHLLDLRQRAEQVLRENDVGCYTRPAPRLYPHQWNWDSAFIAIGWSHVDEDRAWSEIFSLLRGQWKHGMIPHIVFEPSVQDYHPGPAFWDVSISRDSPEGVMTSGITQPPILAIAALQLYEQAEDKEKAIQKLKNIYSPLKQYHAWLVRFRDPGKEGLVSIVHPWESGMDNSSRWDLPLRHVQFERKPVFRRVDDTFVPPEQRPSDEEYDRYSGLVLSFKDAGYDPAIIVAKSPFLVQPILFNVLFLEAQRALQQIGMILNLETISTDRWIDRSQRAIQEKLWDDDLGVYVDVDVRRNQSIVRDTIAHILPMYAGIPSKATAGEWVEKLRCGAHFWPMSGYPFCTVSMEAAEFDPQKYWRGPVWMNMNWFMIQGLSRYGYVEEARQVLEMSIRLIQRSGFFEYFDPLTGEGYGSDRFSWTAALIIDMIQRYLQNEIGDST